MTTDRDTEFALRLKAAALWRLVDREITLRERESPGLREWVDQNESKTARLIYAAVEAQPGLRLPPTRENIAAWAQSSYPEKGDGGFLVRGSAPSPGSLAADFYGALQGIFVKRMFVSDIQRVLADRADTGAITIEQQEEARRIWSQDAAKYLKDMYVAHDYGQIPYGERYGAVKAWMNKHYPVTSKRRKAKVDD